MGEDTGGYTWLLADWFGLGQLVVGILGFGLAIWQLARTAAATELGNKLLTRRLLTNDLLVLLPELHRLEDAIHEGMKRDNRDMAADALLAYARHVSMAVGYLKSDNELKDENAVKVLGQAAKAAIAAKSDLYARTDEISVVTEAVRRKISSASVEVGELIARLRKKAEENR